MMGHIIMKIILIQLVGFLPALWKKFILIVDDWNWKQVRKGTLDSIKKKT